MVSKAALEKFFAPKSLAIAGASRKSVKFGNMIYKELKAKGYRVFAINPNADMVEGDPCYPNLAALPEKVGGVVIVLPPERAVDVVREAAQVGIKNVWLQQGAESKAAIELGEQNGLNLIAGECLLMYAEPVGSLHGIHRFFKFLFGGRPK